MAPSASRFANPRVNPYVNARVATGQDPDAFMRHLEQLEQQRLAAEHSLRAAFLADQRQRQLYAQQQQEFTPYASPTPIYSPSPTTPPQPRYVTSAPEAYQPVYDYSPVWTPGRACRYAGQRPY